MTLIVRRWSVFMLLALALGLAGVEIAQAQQIDLSLNVIHSNPVDPTSAGTWQLVGKSSHSGMVSVNTFLTGINAPLSNVAPRGVVNGDPCSGVQTSGCAGFYNFGAVTHPGYVDLIVGQAPIGFLGAGDEEGVFYGVGTLTNGAPNYPGKPGGSNSIGPAFTSLTNVMGVAWATGDVFSNPAWSTAAILASGTFSSGMTPGFYAPLNSTGAVFTTVGTSTTFGTITTATSISEIVRTNLMPGNDGDYNNDGVVNAADYVFWRDTLGKVVPAFAEADGNGSGTINAPDYDHWKARFGNLSPGAGAGAGALAVPEPSTVLLAMLLASFFVVRRQSLGGRS